MSAREGPFPYRAPPVPHSKSCPTANPWTRKQNLKWSKNGWRRIRPKETRRETKLSWVLAGVCPPPVFSATSRYSTTRRAGFFTLLTCETSTCISETCWVLIKHGVSWRVFGLCFFFSGQQKGIFCWIIRSERLGIGFVSSVERPRRRWSDASVCYRSDFTEAVHLRLLLSAFTTTLRRCC